MHAIILAGGKGTRLRPFTVSFPKPLVPLGELPIIEVVIRQLASRGFTRITISTGHLAELIVAFCGDGSKWGVRIDYVHEDVPLSTAGPLALVDDIDDHVLVMNGDVLTDLDYDALVAQHVASGATATVATTTRESQIDFGIVESDEDGWLTRWIEKPTHSYQVSMGVYVLSRGAVSLIGDGEAIGMPDLLLRVKDGGGSVLARRCDCYWLDIGRLDDYERAQNEFAEKASRLLPADD